MKPIIEKILSIPKSLYVSIRLFPLHDALKLPCLVRYNTKILDLKGQIKVKNGIVKPFMFHFGFGGVGVFDKRYERSILQIGGILEIEGNATFGHGCRICVTKNAIVNIGADFVNTAAMTLICAHRIYIGTRVTVSWNVLIMDTDWHNTINTKTNSVGCHYRPIYIGDKTWIGTRSIILKGSYLPKGCIVGAGAVVTKQYMEDNICIAGNPANVVKKDITMYRE